MRDLFFEAPRGASPEEIYRWALETTEKLNRLQSIANSNDREVNYGLHKRQGNP